jgi:hypothetical protein
MNKSTQERRAARLLIVCARPDPGPDGRKELAGLLSQGPDWEPLVGRAEGEGLVPLLYWNLRSRADEVPAAVLERLRVHYLKNVARNVRIAEQARAFLNAVRESGSTVVLTKGLALASSVYPDLGLRPFWDVDIFALPEEWPAVRRILEARGFQETPGTRQDPCGDSTGHDTMYSPYFRRGDLVLEFHFNIPGLQFPARRDSLADLTDGTAAAPAQAFRPEFELCHLCLHAQQHSYQRLVWLTDIAEIVSRKKIGWAEVFRICDTLKIRGSVYHGLTLAEALWPGTVPPSVRRKLSPGPLERAALRFFWPTTAVAGRGRSFAWPYYTPTLFSLLERRSARLTARTLPAILFPPKPWLALACGLPPTSGRLYYQYARRLLRPFGLAARRFLRAR